MAHRNFVFHPMGPLFIVWALMSLSALSAAQNYEFLIVNCNWERTQVMEQGRYNDGRNKLVLETPNMNRSSTHNLVSNLVCRTRILADIPYNRWLRITFNLLNLTGPRECEKESEKLTLSFNSREPKSMSFCGDVKPLFLMVKEGDIDVTYTTGNLGEEKGFRLTFEFVDISRCSLEKFEVTETPQLLYSYGYPYNLSSRYDCNLSLEAPHGYSIHIRSLLMDLNWGQDEISFNEKMYYTDERISWWSQEETVKVQPFTKYYVPGRRGYVLEFYAAKRNTVYCSAGSVRNITAMEKLSLLELTFASGTARCTVSLDSGHDDYVLGLTMFDHLDNPSCEELSMEVFLDDAQTPLFRSCGQQKPFHNLQSPGRKVTLQVNIDMKSFSVTPFRPQRISIQAVRKDQLVPTADVSGTSSYMWISLHMMRSRSQVMTNLLLEKTTGGVVVALWNGDDNNSLVGTVQVFNGDNSSFFELTRDCNSEPRPEKEVYSSMTDVVSLKVTGSTNRQQGNWIKFIYAHSRIWATKTSGTSFKFGELMSVNLGNLVCRWEILIQPLHWVKFKVDTNLALPQSLNVSEILGPMDFGISWSVRKTYLGSLIEPHFQEKWLYSNSSLELLLKIPAPVYHPSDISFSFQYEMVPETNLDFHTSCRQEILVATSDQQVAQTINYPNLLVKNLNCSWIIMKSNDAKGYIYIEFGELPMFTCGYDQLVISSWPSTQRKDFICGPSVPINFTYPSAVSIILTTSSHKPMPGFWFQYYLKEPEYVKSCNKTYTLTTHETLSLSGEFKPGEYYGTVTCWFVLKSENPLYGIKLSAKRISLLPRGDRFCSLDKNRMDIYEGQDEHGRYIGRWCEESYPTSISGGSDIFIKLTITSSTYKELSFSLSADQSLECESAPKTLNVQRFRTTMITSPGYPGPYPPEAFCKWIFEADWDRIIQIRIIQAEIEYDKNCNFDHLQIFDRAENGDPLSRRICGVVKDVFYYTPDASAQIVFVSDKAGQPGNFLISAEAVPSSTHSPGTDWDEVMSDGKDDSSEDDGNSPSVAEAVGVVTGVVFFFFFIVVVAMFVIIHRRRRAQRDRQRTDSVQRNSREREPTVFVMNASVSHIYHGEPPPYPGIDSSYGNDLYTELQPPLYDVGETSLEDPPPYSPDMPGGPQAEACPSGNQTASLSAMPNASSDDNGSSNRHAPIAQGEESVYDDLGEDEDELPAYSMVSPFPEEPPPQYDYAVTQRVDDAMRDRQGHGTRNTGRLGSL